MKFSFMDLLGESVSLPFSIEVIPEDKFETILLGVINQNVGEGKRIPTTFVQISNLSAVVPIPAVDIGLTAEEIEKKYGTSFCIRESPLYSSSKLFNNPKQ